MIREAMTGRAHLPVCLAQNTSFGCPTELLARFDEAVGSWLLPGGFELLDLSEDMTGESGGAVGNSGSYLVIDTKVG